MALLAGWRERGRRGGRIRKMKGNRFIVAIVKYSATLKKYVRLEENA